MIPRRRLSFRFRDVSFWCRSLAGDARGRDDVRAFEAGFREYLGCEFARAVASGRDAMMLAFKAVGLRPGDEVIVPAYTLGELLPLMQAHGLRPVAADIEPVGFNIDVESVRARITPATRAVLATHLFGAPCDIEALCALADERGLSVVEDCAHALGATVNGRKVGTFGAASFFSLEVNKALPTYGGGIVVVKDAGRGADIAREIDERPVTEWPALKKALLAWIEEGVIRSPIYGLAARVLFSPLMAARFERAYRGSHDRIRRKVAFSVFQARLGIARLRDLDPRNAALNARFDALAAGLPAGLVAQRRDLAGEPAFYNFVALSEIPPADLRRLAMRRGLDIGIGGEVADDGAAALGASDCPVAANVHARAVLLPLYGGLNDRRFDRLTAAMQEIFPVRGR